MQVHKNLVKLTADADLYEGCVSPTHLVKEVKESQAWDVFGPPDL